MGRIDHFEVFPDLTIAADRTMVSDKSANPEVRVADLHARDVGGLTQKCDFTEGRVR